MGSRLKLSLAILALLNWSADWLPNWRSNPGLGLTVMRSSRPISPARMVMDRRSPQARHQVVLGLFFPGERCVEESISTPAEEPVQDHRKVHAWQISHIPVCFEIISYKKTSPPRLREYRLNR